VEELRMRRATVAVAVALLAVGCNTQLKPDNRPCPCATGWTCCANMNVCVRGGTSCPLPSPAPALTVTPASVSLPLGGTAQLSATVSVSWSLQEANAPITVDAQGNVRASSQHGIYHVVATSTSNPAETETASVAVGPTRIDVFLGTPGGIGNADGVGSAARFGGAGLPSGITGDGHGNL
jgi:hypothetical protein